jgi:broad specificity phosphatase PhoE
MPPNLLLIRHAQGFHNLNTSGHYFHDPGLTLHGESQCRNLASQLTGLPPIDYIVASPLRRTLYTALYAFSALLAANPTLRIVALPALQETSDLPCDTGSSVAELQAEFGDAPIDFSRVGDGWTNKVTGLYTPHSERIDARCREARVFLRGLDAENVAVVTHGAVLHYLTGDWEGATTGVGTGWENCEKRCYRFVDGFGEDAEIVEGDEARKERVGGGDGGDEGRQAELRKEAEMSWASDGYIVIGGGDCDFDKVEGERAGMRCVIL